MVRENTSTCRYDGCGKLIAWASTDSGKRLPLDVEAVKDGEWVVFEQRDRTLRAEAFNPAEPLHAMGSMKRFRRHACARRPQRAVDQCQAPGCTETPARPWEVACERQHLKQLPGELRNRLRHLWDKRPATREHATAVREAQELLARAAGQGVERA